MVRQSGVVHRLGCHLGADMVVALGPGTTTQVVGQNGFRASSTHREQQEGALMTQPTVWGSLVRALELAQFRIDLGGLVGFVEREAAADEAPARSGCAAS